ncbi:hypothetical protein D3C87_1561220 [compost metagenome]
MPLPVSLRIMHTCPSAGVSISMLNVPPLGMASRALANRLLRICVSSTCWLTTGGTLLGVNRTSTFERLISGSKAPSVSSMASTRSTSS